MSARTQACGGCGTAVPVVEGYVTWCHECGWNLQAPASVTPDGRLGRLYERAGRRLGDRLLAQVERTDRLEPRLTVAKAAAYTVAVLVHTAAVLLLAGGVLLIAYDFPNPTTIFIGVIAVGTGLSMRPRFGKAPDEGLLARAAAPELYALVDEVADRLDTPRVDTIVVDHTYNASWSVVGLRRTRVLTLGLPLWAALAPQQRAALVAHELAHARNGDATRGFVIGSAVLALGELYRILAPRESWEMDHSELAFLERIMNGFFWLVSRPVLGLLLLELHLLLRDSQRAEYLADALAADVAGAAAVVDLHESLLLESTMQAVVRSAAHDERNIFAELAVAFSAVPERERERRRRVARLQTARLSSTHPPTAHRIRALERRAAAEPKLALDGARSSAIDAELAPLHRDLQRRLVEEYRDALYH